VSIRRGCGFETTTEHPRTDREKSCVTGRLRDSAAHSNLAWCRLVGPHLSGRWNKEATSMAKSESTSKKVASAASKVLHSKSATKAEKSVAASALTQKGSTETTSAKVAASAAKILRSKTASKAAKSAAASALTQKVKAKKKK
jgi:hypothetical protein